MVGEFQAPNEEFLEQERRKRLPYVPPDPMAMVPLTVDPEPFGLKIPAPAERFAVNWFADTPEKTSTEWVIEDFIDKGALLQMFGESQSGKSYLALSASFSVSRGVEWLGRRVIQAPTLYIAAEAGKGIAPRIAAYRKETGCEDETPWFAWIDQAPDLTNPDDVEAIIEQARKVAERCEQPVGLITVDTMRDSMKGDDNSSGDTREYFEGCKRIVRETTASLISVHHSGHGNKERGRGSSGIYATVDMEWRVENKENPRLVTCTKDRDHGVSQQEFAFSLKGGIEVGSDNFGKPSTACVVEAADAPEPRKAGEKGIGGQAGVAFKMIRRAIEEAGTDPIPNNHVPQGVKVVSLDLCKEYCRQGGLVDSDKPDAFRQAFHRVKATLLNKGAIGVWNECVWIV